MPEQRVQTTVESTVETTVETTAGATVETSEEQETLAVPVAALRPSLEALLMVADEPLDTVTLATAVGYPVEEVTGALEALAAEYTEQGRGFELRNVGGGWPSSTRDEYA